jgi:hypothetical protein
MRYKFVLYPKVRYKEGTILYEMNLYWNDMVINKGIKKAHNYWAFIGLMVFGSPVIKWDYFPIQNLPKMFPRISSLVISPVISPRWCRAFRISTVSRSGERPDAKPA